MTMPSDQGIRFACQTYSWQMSLATYRGRLDHMIGVAARAGFTGLEAEIVMLGEDWTAEALRDVLDRHGIALAALCLVCDWREEAETDEERHLAERVIDAVKSIPGAILNLCQYPGPDRRDLADRQRRALSCLAAISRRAADRGVDCTFHPNSPPGSIFRTATDYRILLEGLPAELGFTPDLGHIVAGGMDPLDVLRTYRDRINHIHYKDRAAEGEWAPTGEGTIDFPAVTDYLARSGYSGWIVMEDESPNAEADPDRAVMNNGSYARAVLEGVLG